MVPVMGKLIPSSPTHSFLSCAVALRDNGVSRAGSISAVSTHLLETRMMTRKDFRLIADAINETRHQVIRHGSADETSIRLNELDCVTQSLLENLRTTNPRFDCSRFIAACRKDD